MICVCSLGTFSSVYNNFSATSEIPKVRSNLVEHHSFVVKIVEFS